MSLRVDTSSLITGALVCGDRGLGVLGSDIPSDGDAGAGYIYNDLTLPADASKEVCGRITSWPSSGTLFAYEDTSFEFTGAPDGRYTFGYTLYVDGVSSGSATVTLDVGETTNERTVAARAWARGADTVAPLRTESASGRIRAKATNTVEHIDAGAVSRTVAGKVRARGAAATLAIRATSIVGRVQARGADNVTSTRLSLAAGRVRGRAAVAAAPVIAGMVTTTAAGRLRARGSSTATLTRLEAVAGRVTARGTDTANSIRAAAAAGRLRSRGRATAGPYVAPELPVIVPPSTRTLSPDHTRLGLSPVAPAKPRLG